MALVLVAVVIAGAFAAALFVIPVRDYLAQDDTIAERSSQLERLQSVVTDLEAEVARARTASGVREAAREELGYVEAGEQRTSIVDAGVVPTALPAGWPYSLITGIHALRAATLAAPATVAAP